MRSQKQAVDGVRFVRWSDKILKANTRKIMGSPYDSLSGNHWHVKLGQSSAWVITTSYRYGAFFFLDNGGLHGMAADCK